MDTHFAAVTTDVYKIGMLLRDVTGNDVLDLRPLFLKGSFLLQY